MPLSRLREIGAYGFALLSVAVASAVRFALDPIVHQKGPFLIFAFAVIAAALYGGLKGGLTATLVSAVVGDYLFIDPRHTFFLYDAFGDSAMLVTFVALGTAVSIIVERLNAARALLFAHQEDLRLANERFAMATDVANEAIWEWNVETRSASWSDLYSKRFGRSPADSRMEWWIEHIHPEDRERVRGSFVAALEGDAVSWLCEYRMLCVDGTWADIYDRARIARNEGRPIRMIGAMLDVTETKRAREDLERRTEELARSNADLQRFAFVVSHDLQAPLRAIGEHSRHLADTNLNDEAARILTSILDGVERMRAIIHDLLEFAQVSKAPSWPGTRIDSNVILQLALQHLEPRIHETGAQITADPLPFVTMSETRLLRVLQNLIGNGLRYCERTPSIHISAHPDDQMEDMCVFSVTDNGIGIAPEYHDRIFGLFERLHSRDRFPGTGLGLAIVKRIVESSGGRIWIESQVGKGSTFWFTLPSAD